MSETIVLTGLLLIMAPVLLLPFFLRRAGGLALVRPLDEPYSVAFER